MKRRVALATSADLPDLAEDDRGLLDELRARGAEADPTVWSEPSVEWSAYDAVVVRSCWDYHLRLDEFVGWIDRVERDGVRLLNPPELLRWNA
ncbi:MAG TPA: hypothetical protein VKE69_07055, partial [Planctomycetota bacterium]|nr:hypothetical protein [Planctomycetota bacterium]